MLPPTCWQSLRPPQKRLGCFRRALRRRVSRPRLPDLLVREARLRDLTIVPAVLEGHNYRWYAESIVFGSGRPVLILPPRGRTPELPLDTIAIAWDGSRPAARAVADALPILERAREVHVLTVLNEKELSSELPASELSKYLERRGIAAKPESIDAAGHPIGEVLSSYLASNQSGPSGDGRVRPFTR